MGSRFPAPTPISERPTRGRADEIVLEPVDAIAEAVSDFGDELAKLQRQCLSLSQKLGNLQAAIAAERQMQTLSPLMTTREVAAYLQVTEDTVRELKQRGKLKAVQVGVASPRFRQVDVAAFLDGVRSR